MSSRSLDKENFCERKKEMRVMKWAERGEDLNVSGAVTSNRVAALFVFAALLVCLPETRAQQPSDAPPAGSAQNGKKLFMSDGCYECHGQMGQGAAQTGAARIGPPQLSFEGFQSYVRSPKNNMPPYTAKAIPDQDLTDIYAYLKSIPMPPKGKDIPLLNK